MTRLASLARWALVAAILLMGAALAVTAWSTHAGVRDASESLIRGQADLIHHDIRVRLSELGGPPRDADLQEILDDHDAEGLDLVAIVGADNQVLARAGAEVGEDWAGLSSDTPVLAGGRVREVFRGPPRRRWGGRAHPVAATAVLIEFEPRQADELREAADRTVLIGGLAAGTLLVLALGLVRWFMRRAAVERVRERERRLASLGELSAVLAHEIRNPLTSLKGNAQLLAEMLPEGDKPRAKADRVVEEAIRLEELSNDLLEFARTGELHLVQVDPAALLAEAAAMVSPDIHIDAARAPATWPLDPDRVRQVLMNLLDNAVQAGAPVRAAVSVAAGRLVFEVRDSGPGVAAEDVGRIFEPFFTRRTRGTGLGLAVVKRVIELHRGTISVENPVEGGARFRVALPRSS